MVDGGGIGGRGVVSGGGRERFALILVVVHTEGDWLTSRVQGPIHGYGENVLNDMLDDLLATDGALVGEIHRAVLGRNYQLFLLL